MSRGSKLLASPRISADRERTERIAVIRLPSRDHVPALRLAFLDEILARELERGFDRLRASRDEVDLVERFRRVRDEHIGQRLHRLVREERGGAQTQAARAGAGSPRSPRGPE
jgi:hypothetical protein